MRTLFSLLIFLILSALVSAQPLSKVDREFRAVWVATVDNIDFPTKKGLPVEQQKAELTAIVDLAKKLHLNAIIFQVRPMADAVYKSKLEPWSEFLTGEMGKEQDFDPLEFLVAEAHKRGILVHAWFNPYRADLPAAKTMSPFHISETNPMIVPRYGTHKWLDPTDPAVQQYSLKVIADVVTRYDIDGVHFDDYFYPYPENDASDKRIEFFDDKNWKEYLKTAAQMSQTSGIMRIPLSRDDWRRWNVNSFIEAVGREIKRIKPDIVYGISPFGIWQPDPALGIKGMNSYKELYADSRKWLQDGTVDYLSPQLYWETARKEQSFPVLFNWWKQQNTKHRFVWPGLAAYRIGATPAFTTGELASQIGMTRESPETSGAIFFSERSLRNDLGGVQRELGEQVYKADAIIPHFAWIKTEAVRSPKVIVKRDPQFVRASWRETGTRKAFWFVVYAKDKHGWSHSVLPASEMSITLSASRKIQKIVVTSVDRLGNESH